MGVISRRNGSKCPRGKRRWLIPFWFTVTTFVKPILWWLLVKEFFICRVFEWRSRIDQLRSSSTLSTTFVRLPSFIRWKSDGTTIIFAHYRYIIHRLVNSSFFLAALFRPAVVQFKNINWFFRLIFLAVGSNRWYVQSICWITHFFFLISKEFNLRFYFVYVLLIFLRVNWLFIIF